MVTTVPAVTSRNFRRGLIAAAAVGLAVRLAYILIVRRDVAPGGDSFFYHLGTRLLVEGRGFIEPSPLINGIIEQSASHPPLYLLYLAIPTSVGLDGPLSHMLWSSLVGVATVVVVGLTGREIAGPRAGLVAAGLAAVYPNLWVFDGFLLSETIAIFTAATATLLAYRYYKNPTTWRAAWLGVACGFAALARAELILLLPLVVVPVVLLTRGTARRERLQRLLAAGLATAIVIGPWVGYNLTRFNRPVFLSSGLEPTLLGANCDVTYYGDRLAYFNPECVEIANITRKRGEDQSDRAAKAREAALEYIGNHKSRVPVVVAARWGRVTGLYRPWQQRDIDVSIEGREWWVATSALLSFYVMAGVAVAGAVVLRRRRVPVYPLAALPLIVLIAVGMTLGSNRYRASAEAALVVLAAIAVDASISAWRARRREPAVDTRREATDFSEASTDVAVSTPSPER